MTGLRKVRTRLLALAMVALLAAATALGVSYGGGANAAKKATGTRLKPRMISEAVAADLSKIGLTLSPPTDDSPSVSAAQAIAAAKQQVGGTVTGAALQHCANGATTPPLDVDCWIVSETPRSFAALVTGAGVAPVDRTVPTAPPTFSVVAIDSHSGAFILAASG